jgi:hypothetical protein
MGLNPPAEHPDELMPKGDGIPKFVLREMGKMIDEEKWHLLPLIKSLMILKKTDLM